MRKSLFFLLSLSCLTLSAQKTMSLDQVKSRWQTLNIKVNGSQTNIMQLVQAFQKTFPTYSGGELIKFSRSQKPYDNNDKVVDLKNGYALYSEDNPDSENNEILQACVWKRSNGHSLFAVSLHRFTPELEVLCFYDYNPKTRTLTPEKNLAKLFTPSFPGYRYRVYLPQNGKNLTVNEYFGALVIEHAYSWDGMKPAHPQTTIEHFENLQATFANHVFFADEHPLSRYTLVDIDHDGFPELWLSSDEGDYQAVFAVKQTCDYIAGQDDRRILTFYNGAVCHSGHCGTGCMSSVYTKLDNSCRSVVLTDMEIYDQQTEDFGPNVYTFQGKEVSKTEGEKFISSLGKEVQLNPQWKALVF